MIKKLFVSTMVVFILSQAALADGIFNQVDSMLNSVNKTFDRVDRTENTINRTQERFPTQNNGQPVYNDRRNAPESIYYPPQGQYPQRAPAPQTQQLTHEEMMILQRAEQIRQRQQAPRYYTNN